MLDPALVDENRPQHVRNEIPTRTFTYPSIDNLSENEWPPDLLIQTNGQYFRVHKAIVCKHSSFFEEQCHGQEQVRTLLPQRRSLSLTLPKRRVSRKM